MTGDVGEVLLSVLEQSRERGFLGPGPIEAQRAHALCFVESLVGVRRVVDLGSGGGVPGLVLAVALPMVEFALLDGTRRRCDFLETAVAQLGFTDRVQVICGRAEVLARRDDLRSRFDAVVARSFAPPAITAECAVGFLDGPGSRLLVSEPPSGSAARWPPPGLAELNLSVGARRATANGTVQELVATGPCPERYPRRTGIPAKRPLF